ncbi:MAG: prepilin-type N-terminal cleavage/methylation domain-containing protein [Verrucomicrobiota bacterium]
MQGGATPPARCSTSWQGFTLVELLTVIAIIAVLATLLTTALASSKRKARQVTCIANLHQVGLAINIYLEDERRRPFDLGQLVPRKYIAGTNSLRCPEDKLGDWGGRVQSVGMRVSLSPEEYVPYSYLHPLSTDDWTWDLLKKRENSLGVAVCQLHGLGKQNPLSPSMSDFEGLIWRGQLDGVVVRRQFFWQFREAIAAPPTGPTPGLGAAFDGGGGPPAQFFVDELPEP